MLEKKEHQYEKAVLVGLITQHQDEEKLTEYLDELEFLAYTAGATVEKRFTQKLSQPDSRTFVGSGKAEEIKNFVKENEIGTVIFDDELSPSQLKNLEREMEVKILDRTNLILDIFAQRAQTSYARTQVELAQYQYLLPRLTRMCEVKDNISNGEAIILLTKECLSVSHKPVINVVRQETDLLLSVQIGKYTSIGVKIACSCKYIDTMNEIENNNLRDIIEFIHINYSIINSMTVIYYSNEED